MTPVVPFRRARTRSETLRRLEAQQILPFMVEERGQAALLRVLKAGRFARVGSAREVSYDAASRPRSVLLGGARRVARTVRVLPAGQGRLLRLYMHPGVQHASGLPPPELEQQPK